MVHRRGSSSACAALTKAFGRWCTSGRETDWAHGSARRRRASSPKCGPSRGLEGDLAAQNSAANGRFGFRQGAYLRDAGRFRAFFAKPLQLVTLSDVQVFADTLTSRATTSQARTLSAIKSLLSFGHRHGYLPYDVGCSVRLPIMKASLAERILADPTVLGIADSYGIEFALVLNQTGLVADWECATANVHDRTFSPLVARFVEEMIVLPDQGFHARTGDRAHMKVCRKGEWNVRMRVETVLSMLTAVCHFKHMRHRLWACFQAHLAFAMALFTILVQWHGLEADEHGCIHFSIAAFSL